MRLPGRVYVLPTLTVPSGSTYGSSYHDSVLSERMIRRIRRWVIRGHCLALRIYIDFLTVLNKI